MQKTFPKGLTRSFKDKSYNQAISIIEVQFMPSRYNFFFLKVSLIKVGSDNRNIHQLLILIQLKLNSKPNSEKSEISYSKILIRILYAHLSSAPNF